MGSLQPHIHRGSSSWRTQDGAPFLTPPASRSLSKTNASRRGSEPRQSQRGRRRASKCFLNAKAAIQHDSNNNNNSNNQCWPGCVFGQRYSRGLGYASISLKGCPGPGQQPLTPRASLAPMGRSHRESELQSPWVRPGMERALGQGPVAMVDAHVDDGIRLDVVHV